MSGDRASGGEASAGEASGGEASAPPVALRIVRGTPTAEELAALVIVLAARSGGGRSSSAPVSRWADPRRLVRGTMPPPRGGWRASALPR